MLHSVNSTLHQKDADLVSEYDAAADVESIEPLLKHTVKRNLESRHVAMIAIGGTIGTGLFISTSNTLSNAGPVSSLISFLFMTSLVFPITQGLGEMATYIPVTGSFSQFATRWCSPALGAANGWNYWFAWTIAYALELSIVGQIIEYWTDAVPLAAWISIFLVLLTVANLFPVQYYGEVEFWVSMIKVVAIVGWLIYALCIVCGAGQTGPVGFRYWRNPGPWGPGILVDSKTHKALGRFLGWVQSLVSAAFTFLGCELVGISVGEVKNPHKTVPSAIRKVLFRILTFYILSMFFIGLTVPFNDPRIQSNSLGSYTHSSPYIVAMQIAGTKVLPDIFNAVILVTIISAGNSNIYCGSRILYGLAEVNVAPKWFKLTTKKGVPYVAVLFTSAFGALGYLACSKQGNEAFTWLLNITTTSALIAWGWISVSHLRFMSILKHRNISRDSLPFKAKFMPFMGWYAAIAVFIIVFIQGFAVFFDFTASDFFTAYISLILFVVCWIVFHFIFNGVNKEAFTWKSLYVPLDECDIDSGVRAVDEYEEEEFRGKHNLWQKLWDWIS